MADRTNPVEQNMFSKVDELPDESIKSLVPQMLSVLSRAESPEFPNVLRCLRKRENLVFPFISDILRSADGNSKYWVMSQLIPGFTPEHKQALRKDLECICYAPSCTDEDMALSDCAEDCLEKCFGA